MTCRLCQDVRETAIETQTKTDPHSLNCVSAAKKEIKYKHCEFIFVEVPKVKKEEVMCLFQTLQVNALKKSKLSEF